MHIKKTITLSLLSILALTSCTLGKGDYEIESLTRSERALVELELSYIAEIIPLAKDLVDLSNSKKVFDADGNTGHSNFKSELSNSKTTVNNFFDDGRIVSGYSDRGQCLYMENYDWEEIIMIDRYYLEASDPVVPQCLIHEGVHAKHNDGHDNGLDTWIDNNTSSTTSLSFLNQVQNYQDVSYLTDFYYDPSEDLFLEYIGLIELCDYHSTTEIDEETYLDSYVEESCEEWAEDIASDIWRDREEILSELGVTEEETYEWVYNSNLCQDSVSYCEELIE